MFFALITLLTSLVISGVAIYYSVSGLAAIFAAAAVPIIIMGASLEIGKLVTALWLHKNWKTAPFILKTYLMIATLILMFITSIGIFGFLSRAHIEQTAGIGIVSTQIEQLNLDAQLEKDKIENNRKIIIQLDAAVNNLLQGSASNAVRNNNRTAQLTQQATRLRQTQNTERTRLQNEITLSNARVADLNRQKLQFDQQIKNIETEVGPIKYIAQFVYGNDASTNKDLLEKAVTWLILIIIFVFDPLAVLLLIASQISWTEAIARWRAKKNKKNIEHPVSTAEKTVVETQNSTSNTMSSIVDPVSIQPSADNIITPINLPTVNIQTPEADQSIPVKENHTTNLEDTILSETKQIVEELLPLKKKRVLHDKKRKPTVESRKEVTTGYVQNSEQGTETIWQRVQKIKNIYKPMDILYAAYEQTGFKDLDLSNHDQSDLEIQKLTSYIEAVKIKEIKLDDIPFEYRERLSRLIIGDDINSSNAT